MSSRTTYEGRGENRYTTGPKEDLGRAIRLNRAEQSRTEPICFVAIRCSTREAEGSRREPKAAELARFDPLAFEKKEEKKRDIEISASLTILKQQGIIFGAMGNK